MSNIYEQYFIRVPVKQKTISQIVNEKDCSIYKQFIINNFNINILIYINNSLAETFCWKIGLLLLQHFFEIFYRKYSIEVKIIIV